MKAGAVTKQASHLITAPLCHDLVCPAISTRQTDRYSIATTVITGANRSWETFFLFALKGISSFSRVFAFLSPWLSALLLAMMQRDYESIGI
jgi:hypothetical protein